ncbi:MAG: thioredoxin domain-containing protein, partial [Cyanobacteriota bacterium]|nr:thioredoxin domain-containing protein [Cyanobacteriota bacterium]
LIVRERGYIDNATPSANGVAIANLVRLALLTRNPDYLARAERGLQAFSGVMQRSAQACPSLFSALDWYRNGTLAQTTDELLQATIPQYFPRTVCALETHLPEGAVGLVCQGLTCGEPAQSEEDFLQQLRETYDNSDRSQFIA